MADNKEMALVDTHGDIIEHHDDAQVIEMG
jgi:hypothetical protein